MAGGAERHARLITNALLELSSAPKGRDGFVHTDALGVRVQIPTGEPAGDGPAGDGATGDGVR